MLEGKAMVQDTDMPVKMQIQAMSAASHALDLFDVSDCRSIAAHIKKEFDGSAAGETNKKFNNASPKNIKKSWSPRSDQGHQASSAPHMCVCAPATHAGSFKCRLHRVNSSGHSPRSPTLHQQAAVPAPPSNTVTAQ